MGNIASCEELGLEVVAEAVVEEGQIVCCGSGGLCVCLQLWVHHAACKRYSNIQPNLPTLWEKDGERDLINTR